MTVPPARLAAAMLAVGTLVACSKSDSAGDAVQAVVDVRTAVVTAQPFTETIGALGLVTGRVGHVASLAAPAATRVLRVMVSVGQHVAAGTELVELDPTPFVGASRAADAALATAERTYERTKRLVDAGISPRKELDQAASDLEQARANAATSRRQEELSLIRAPIGGVVTRVGAVLGATADPSQVLVEIADPNALDIMFSVTPTQAARVQPGAKVTLSAGQNASGEPLGVATVVDVGGIVDTASRGVTIRAQAPTTRRPLRIGETVFGEIMVAVRNNAIVVPIEALVPEGEEFKLFVVDAAGMARARTVTVGARTDKLAEITAGLNIGEHIVTYGAYGIEDSAKVIATPANASPAAAPNPPR